MRLRPVLLGVPAVLLAWSSAAIAQLPSVDVRGFRPPTDPGGSIYLEPATTPGAGQWNAALWGSYAWRPAVLRDESKVVSDKLVGYQVSTDFVANVGITKIGSLGVDLPLVVSQGGESSNTTRRVLGDSSLPPQALGDMALTAKANVLSYGEMGGFGLAGLARVTLPTGDRTSYVGEGAPTSELRLLAEYKLVAISVQGTAGFKLRTEERDFLDRTFGNEIPWGAAVALRPQALGLDDKGHWTWVVEGHGSKMLAPSADARDRGQSTALSPTYVGASARYAIRDVSILAGVEGSLGTALGAPPVRGLVSLAWAPRSHDRDGDGVDDDVDECPDLAEDKDGFEDGDGCPDWDNDDDQVPDQSDRCPTEKEDQDGFEDEDGCLDADNDRDGVPDTEDACPDVAGPRSPDAKKNGCPVVDKDGDGVPDKTDKCPTEPEDRDGFEDEDGCPDPDNDHDGVPDAEDACPNVAGETSSDPKKNGCPIPDKDRDTFDDGVDKCPAEAEVFNGKDDDDGCPDEGGKPLAAIDEKKGVRSVRLAKPIRWSKGETVELEAASKTTLRALARELNLHPTWSLGVGVRPAGAATEANHGALSRAFSIVQALRGFTHRDGVAETVGWKAVETQPGAVAAGVGLIVLVQEEPAASEAKPEAKPEATPAAQAEPKKDAAPAKPKKP